MPSYGIIIVAMGLSGLALGILFSHQNQSENLLDRLIARDNQNPPSRPEWKVSRQVESNDRRSPASSNASKKPREEIDPKYAKYPLLRWNDLETLVEGNEKNRTEARALIRQVIRIPGFIVPIEIEGKDVTEFLLVPTYGACYHVPPPPPHQMILVKMRGSVPAPKREDGPTWLIGTVHPSPSQSNWGEVSFQMEANEAVPYEGGY